MRILITDNRHVHYDRIGEITDKTGETWRVGIPHRDGSIQTTVKEGQFKVVKEQTTKGIKFEGGPPEHGRYQEQKPSGKVYRPDGLGCVERVHPSELAWEERYG